MKDAKRSLKFRSRRQSTKGIIALLIAIGTVLATVALIVMVTGSGGDTGVLSGVIGLILVAERICSDFLFVYVCNRFLNGVESIDVRIEIGRV